MIGPSDLISNKEAGLANYLRDLTTKNQHNFSNEFHDTIRQNLNVVKFKYFLYLYSELFCL